MTQFYCTLCNIVWMAQQKTPWCPKCKRRCVPDKLEA